jgi:predicted phosphodiesterase
MRALVIADRGPGIDFRNIIDENGIDLVITLGDLERHDLLGLVGIKDIPKIGVYGNHCSGNYMPELGILNLHMATWDFHGVKFGGFQGCVRYKENPDAIMYTQGEATAMLTQFPQVDIFICHCPPRGVNDEDELSHQGFDGLRQYVLQMRPKVLLHGHTYPTEDTMVRKLDLTRVEYVHKWRIVAL